VVKPHALGQETVQQRGRDRTGRGAPHHQRVRGRLSGARGPRHGQARHGAWKTSEGESGENAEEYIDLAISEHDAKRDSKAARAPIAYIDPTNGPTEGPVAFIDLALSDRE
jgi:hypothetical protein